MAKTTRTLVNFILDKSGSMQSVCEATISGFNEYIQSLKKDKKNKYDFSLVLFDTNIIKQHVNTPIEKIKPINKETYNPDGWTALYDAVCSTIDAVQKTVTKNQKVLTVIMTDGEENSSKEYTQEQLKKRVSELERAGKWTFVFLGANQDSWLNAQKFGISKQNTSNFQATDVGMARSMQILTNNTAMFASASSGQTEDFFSPQDQDTLNNTTTNPISEHFSNLGKKSWEARKKKYFQ